IFKKRNEIIRKRRQNETNCLWDDHEPEGLAMSKSQSASGIPLASRHGEQTGTIVFGFRCGIVQAQTKHTSDKRRKPDPDVWKTVENEEELNQKWSSAHELDVSGSKPPDWQRSENAAKCK